MATMQQLWKAWATERDEVAFEKLVRPELPATYHLAQQLGLSAADAEDVVQEALLELAQVRGERPGHVGIGPWLMRAVRFKALTRHRSQRRRRRHEGQERARKDASATSGNREVQEEVDQALEQLGDADRQILMFRFLYDLDYREIAYVLGVSENACRIRVHRASERMRAKLGRQSPALWAAITLPEFPAASGSIAAATKSATGGLSASLIGGVLVSTGIKMAMSAAAAAVVTASVFLAIEPSDPPPTDNLLKAEAADEGRQLHGTAPVPAPQPAARPEGPAPALDVPAREGLSGIGKITGRVTTKDGEGVGGIVLIATPQIQRTRAEPGSIPSEPNLEREIRKAAEDAHRRVTGTRRATSNAQGYYRLTGLADVPFIVAAHGRSHDVRVAKGHKAWGAKPGAEIDFVATPSVSVRIRMEGYDADLNHGRAGILRAETEKGLQTTGAGWWSPDRNVVRMPPGTWWLQGVQGADRERASPPTEVTLVANGEVHDVTLTLAERPGLRGTIQANGIQVSHADIWALRFEGSDPPDAESVIGHRNALRGKFDSEDGSYSVRGVETGRYVVGVTLRSREVVGRAVVHITDGMVEQDIEVQIPGLERFTVVRALGPDGEPLEPHGTRFSTSYTGPNGGMSGGGESIPREDGSWLVRYHESAPKPEDAKGGTYVMKVTHRDFGTIERVHDRSQPGELEFRFQKPATVQIRLDGVEEAGLKGIVGLYLRGVLPETGMGLSHRAGSMAGSLVTFDQVQPGRWHLVAMSHPKRNRGPMVAVARRMVTIQPGANELAWRLPTLHTVRLVATDKSQRLSFGLKRIDPDGNFIHQYARAAVGEDAEFRFVPAGRYELIGRYKNTRRSIPIEVPAQTEVTLE